jgi:hypothetical protein
MGWDYRITPLRAEITTEAYVSGLYDFIHANGTIQEVVGTAVVGSTVYLALRITERDRAPYTTALVVLTDRTLGGGIGHKSIDETFGPDEAAAPRSILSLLSPVAEICLYEQGQKWAAGWRAACASKLQEGG